MLAQEQVYGVVLLVHPGSPRVLVESHSPEGDNLSTLLYVKVCESLELLLELFQRLVGVSLGDPRHVVKGVRLQRLLELLKGYYPVLARLLPVLHLELVAGLEVQVFEGNRLVFGDGFYHLVPHGLPFLLRVFRVFGVAPHSVAYVHVSGGKGAVVLYEVPIYSLGVVIHYLVEYVVLYCQVGVGLEDYGYVGEVCRPVGEGGKNHQLDPVRIGELSVYYPCPENGVHLRHVGAPENEGIGQLYVVITARRLVYTEGLYERSNRRSHAVPCVGVYVVRPETRLHELSRRIAFHYGVLS